MKADKIITLRFKTDNVWDMGLYHKIVAGRNNSGVSMPNYVKDLLQKQIDNVSVSDLNYNGSMDDMRNMIHEEADILYDRLIAAFSKTNVQDTAYENRDADDAESMLPGASSEFPDELSGILAQFK